MPPSGTLKFAEQRSLAVDSKKLEDGRRTILDGFPSFLGVDSKELEYVLRTMCDGVPSLLGFRVGGWSYYNFLAFVGPRVCICSPVMGPYLLYMVLKHVVLWLIQVVFVMGR